MHTPYGQDSVLIQCFPSCAPQNAKEKVKKMKVLVAQSCPTLCDPRDYSLLGSCVHGISQARILEWLPCPTTEDLPDPGIKLTSLSPALAGGFFTTSATWEGPSQMEGPVLPGK